MRICGVELAANDAVICLLNKDKQLFDLPECRVRKLSLPKEAVQEDIRQFHFAFNKLMQDYKIDRVAIKARPTKGKFAGGAVSFKLESAIELCELPVEVLLATDIKARLARNPLPIPFSETGLKGFQEQAFLTAYASHFDAVEE